MDSSDTWRSCAFPRTAPGINRRPLMQRCCSYIRIWLYAADIEDISFSTALTPSRTPHHASAAHQHGITSLPRLFFTSIVIQLRLILWTASAGKTTAPRAKPDPAGARWISGLVRLATDAELTRPCHVLTLLRYPSDVTSCSCASKFRGILTKAWRALPTMLRWVVAC